MHSIIKCCVCFFCCLGLFQNRVFAQHVSRTVSSSTGNSITSSGLSISYTIGEPVIATGVGSNVILTQGFQQPDKDIITIINSSEFLMNVDVFPNPVSDQLQVKVNTDKIISDLSVEIEDVFGKQLKRIAVSATGSLDQAVSLDFFSYSSGVYLVRVLSQNEHIHKTFKVIKK